MHTHSHMIRLASGALIGRGSLLLTSEPVVELTGPCQTYSSAASECLAVWQWFSPQYHSVVFSAGVLKDPSVSTALSVRTTERFQIYFPWHLRCWNYPWMCGTRLWPRHNTLAELNALVNKTWQSCSEEHCVLSNQKKRTCMRRCLKWLKGSRFPPLSIRVPKWEALHIKPWCAVQC